MFSQSGIDFDATLVFMCHVAEEQGLMGAKLHAQKAQKEHIPIEAVLQQRHRRRRPSAATASRTARRFACIRKVPRTRPRASWRGSFSAGPCATFRPIPCADGAVRSILAWRRSFRLQPIRVCLLSASASRGKISSSQHDPRDTFEGVTPAYLAQNARVNAAAAATLALAPPPPSLLNERGQPKINRAPSGYDAHLAWAAAPGAAAYRIFWRTAWGPDWQHEMLVGNVTEIVLSEYADRRSCLWHGRS